MSEKKKKENEIKILNQDRPTTTIYFGKPKPSYKEIKAQRALRFDFIDNKFNVLIPKKYNKNDNSLQKPCVFKKKPKDNNVYVREYTEPIPEEKQLVEGHIKKFGLTDEAKRDEQITILDTIKDFFCNFTWPSCCDCDEIKNEEINEINTNTIKTPLNARNK